MMRIRNRIICLISVFLLIMLAGCSAVSGEYAAGRETDKDSADRTTAPGNMEATDIRLPENEDETVVSAGTHSDIRTETAAEGEDAGLENFLMENGKTVWLHVPQNVKDNPENKVPMVLFMCGTSCDPVDNVVQSGWISQADKENFIVISPDYNNYATYSETDFLISVVEYMIANYPVDCSRIYSTGFSNGGAASIALTRDYPEYFAAISAMGWMIDIDNKNDVYGAYDMPFQVVQGDGEFTERTDSGAMSVMKDEREGIRSLFLYNEMIETDTQPDYDKTAYWGYEPDEAKNINMNGARWEFASYYKDGYSAPFAQFVLVEDTKHRPRPEEAAVAWEFFRHFSRDENGKLVELTGGNEVWH